MLGEFSWFQSVFGAVADGDIASNALVAKAAIRAGLGVVLLRPGSKLPICVLSDTERRKQDKEAQNVSRETGSPNWAKVRHDCGLNHALTKETQLNRKVIREALESGANLAVSLKHSERQLIVIDIDDEPQRKAFEDEFGCDFGYTVTSPGTIDPDTQEWLHKDGGHIYFTLPAGVELISQKGKYTDPEGKWCAYFGSGYLLIPPSVRPEGAYLVTGDCTEAPLSLISKINAAGDGLRSSEDLRDTPDDPIAVWSAETAWAELLGADGYTAAGFDGCGCPTWTRPGSPAHAKSVTGHEVGCTRYDTSAGSGPLHIWSDVLGVRTITKLTYYAETRHGGDVSAAMAALGLESNVEHEPMAEFVVELPKALSPYQIRMLRAMTKK